jgi:hypothetical protein
MAQEESGAEELEEIIPEAAFDPKDISSLPVLANLVSSYQKSPFPMMLLDSQLSILFANEAWTALFDPYKLGNARSFSSLFYASLGEEATQGLYRALKSNALGFSWKGSIWSKTRDAATMIAKTYISPLYDLDASPDSPSFFSVLFDNVTEENRSMLRSTFLSLLEASKLKDNDTGRHIERVNLYSRRLAQELFDLRREDYPEVDMDFLDDIAFLAAMHDVGKIGTPDDILNKAGPLVPWERKIMQEHTINGAYILSTYPNPMARQIALSHHEMWNGKGYPYNLEGTMIPLSARIVSIADVYDALRMRRSYKPAFSHDEAAAMILEWKESHFDPDLVEVFEGINGDFRDIYEEWSDKEASGAEASAQ